MVHGIESAESFRSRARAWVRANLERRSSGGSLPLPEAKALQAVIFDAGFAGIAFPRRYGGAGLTFEHQQVWADETRDYVLPGKLYVSIGILGATLLEYGSETLKDDCLPRILRGDDVWVQLLSEPSGGSDMAGALTRAVAQDDATWEINGSKVWTTGAADADYGMCLARTDWEMPKHKGLSMFAVPLRGPGVTVVPIAGVLGGPAEFFQEYFDGLRISGDHLVGPANQGWSVARSLLVHERNCATGTGHGLGLGVEAELAGAHEQPGSCSLSELGQVFGGPWDRQVIAAAYVDQIVRRHLRDRVGPRMNTGVLSGDWGSVLRLGHAVDTVRHAQATIAMKGSDAVIWDGADIPPIARDWLTARARSIAGGTNEIQRNIISERILGLPRDDDPERDVPFRQALARRGVGQRQHR